MKQDYSSQLEPLGAEEMGRIAGGDGWVDPTCQPFVYKVVSWLISTLGSPPSSSYAYGKVGYT